ncbi:hypothetical protein D3C71_426420 [compost metagenome]
MCYVYANIACDVLSRNNVQGYVDIAACRFRVRADGIGDVCQFGRDIVCQPRYAQGQSGLKEVGRTSLAQVHFDVDGQVCGQCDVALGGNQANRCGVAGRPCAGEQLLGFRVRLGSGEYMGRLGGTGGRQLDVEGAVVTA